MSDNSFTLDKLNRAKATFDEYVEVIRQLDELNRRKAELEGDSALISLLVSIEGMGRTTNESTNEEVQGQAIEDTDELGLIAKTRGATVLNLIRTLDHGAIFDRDKIHELAREVIPVWASKNDARSIGGALNSLARKRSIEVYRQAKAGPAGKPAVFRSIEESEAGRAEEKGDSDDAETVTP
jgi:hypothetical protein